MAGAGRQASVCMYVAFSMCASLAPGARILEVAQKFLHMLTHTYRHISVCVRDHIRGTPARTRPCLQGKSVLAGPLGMMGPCLATLATPDGPPLLPLPLSLHTSKPPGLAVVQEGGQQGEHGIAPWGKREASRQ